MQANQKQFTIVSIVSESEMVISPASGEAMRPLVQYWWSTKTKSPYLTGEVEVDWSGPYISEEAAIKSVRRDCPDAEISILPWHLDKEDEPLQFAQSRTYDFELLVTMPLDEYSERAFCNGSEVSQETKDLVYPMRLKVAPKDSDGSADFLVCQVAPSIRQLEGRLFRPNGIASFTMPITLLVRSQEELNHAYLKEHLQSEVTLDEIYPGKMTSALLVPSVF